MTLSLGLDWLVSFAQNRFLPIRFPEIVDERCLIIGSRRWGAGVDAVGGGDGVDAVGGGGWLAGKILVFLLMIVFYI